MKLNRRQLRRLIESTINEENPGSKFGSAVKKGKQNKDAAFKKKASKAFQDTYDWFVRVVFPSIEDDNWPIVADQNYAWWDSLFDDHYIAKGTKWTSLQDRAKLTPGDKPTARSMRAKLSEIYNDLERTVSDGDYRVAMQSDQPTEFEEEAKKGKVSGAARAAGAEKNVNESLSRGSLYRQRYQRY
jgi:hypothetical protein